jgi:cytochrome c
MVRGRHHLIPTVLAGILLLLGLPGLAGSSETSEPAADVPQAFEPCIACHAYQPDEPPLEGPTLWQVMGRRIAGLDNYEYSSGLRAVKGQWDRATLDRFLAAPQAFAPGVLMTFGGVRDAADRTIVLDFLETLAPVERDDGADR